MAKGRVDRILFLDFDGVLNTLEEGRRRGRTPKGWNRLDPDLVERVNEVFRRTECEVVVSSSWRNKVDSKNPLDRDIVRTERAETILRNNGAIFDVYDVTPDLGQYVSRGDEIQAWLDKVDFQDHFAIVDDRDDMKDLRHRLVQTDPRVGIQDKDVEKLCALLLNRRGRR